MRKCFVSIVAVARPNCDLLTTFIRNTHGVLKQNFSDYEIILVNNRMDLDLIPVLTKLEADILKDVTVINLSRSVEIDNAIVAGLDRANGDYTVIWDVSFADKAQMIVDLYVRAQAGFDIVYLRYKRRYIPLPRKAFYRMFYWIIKRYSILQIDPHMHSTRIISRRALNAILQYRETWRYMKGLCALVGYNTSYIESDIQDNREVREPLSSQVRAAIRAIISFTDVVNRVLVGIIGVTIIFAVVVSANALTVKYLHHDIFGHQALEVPGWTFLVIFGALGLASQTFILYMLSIYLTAINDEIKRRPLYIIESVNRF